MEDVSDTPFRLLCKELGADIVYTEFTSCEALVRNVPRALERIRVLDDERPIAVQLYGSAEGSMESAAAIAEGMRPDFIDVNCGCWVKKIAQRGDGAGLLRDLKQFEAVVKAVLRGTTLPVTVKTRLGWDEDSIVILDVARMLEGLGVRALTVHCRTRKQGYTGKADWAWLARIKEVSGVPLIANGDIVAPEQAKALFDMGLDGIMIGRGAIGSPWIFNHIKHYLRNGETLPEPDLHERVALCLRHLKAHVAHRGEKRGVFSFRKYYAGYLKGVANIAHLRRDLMQIEQVDLIEERLRHFLVDYEAHTAAALL